MKCQEVMTRHNKITRESKRRSKIKNIKHEKIEHMVCVKKVEVIKKKYYKEMISKYLNKEMSSMRVEISCRTEG